LEASPEKEEEDEESKVAMEPEAEDQHDDSPFQLLDRLFSFLNTEEKPLNPVLSGYFSKLVTLLLTRRQKQLVPYIFNTENDSKLVDLLLFHVYQKSLSEFLNKLLALSTGDFEEEQAEIISKKQKEIYEKLIEKLGSEEVEDQLNAITLLSENLENKEYFTILSRRENLASLFQIAFKHPSDEGRKSGLNVIIALLNVFIEKHRGSNNDQTDKKVKVEGEEDEVVHSEEEDLQETPEECTIAGFLQEYIHTFPELLGKAPGFYIETTMCEGEIEPLG
jgi:hypothetical protein